MRKPSIPQTPRAGDPRDRFDSALKESLESIMGRRGVPIAPLSSAATTVQIIDKINEIIEVLQ